MENIEFCARCRKKYERAIARLKRNPVFDEVFEAVIGSENGEVPIVEFDSEAEAFNFRTDLYKYRANLARILDATYRDHVILSLRDVGTGWQVVGQRRDKYPRKGRWLIDVESEILALEERLDNEE